MTLSLRVDLDTPCSRAACSILHPLLTASSTASIDSSAHCIHLNIPCFGDCKTAGAHFDRILDVLPCGCSLRFCPLTRKDGITTDYNEQYLIASNNSTTGDYTKHMDKAFKRKTTTIVNAPRELKLFTWYFLRKPSESFCSMYSVDNWYQLIIGNLRSFM